MANKQYHKLEPSELNKIRNCPSGVPSMLDVINDLYSLQEETLLAVMAAGVPANCITILTPKESDRFDFKNPSINIGFKFIRSI